MLNYVHIRRAIMPIQSINVILSQNFLVNTCPEGTRIIVYYDKLISEVLSNGNHNLI